MQNRDISMNSKIILKNNHIDNDLSSKITFDSLARRKIDTASYQEYPYREAILQTSSPRSRQPIFNRTTVTQQEESVYNTTGVFKLKSSLDGSLGRMNIKQRNLQPIHYNSMESALHQN